MECFVVKIPVCVTLGIFQIHQLQRFLSTALVVNLHPH